MMIRILGSGPSFLPNGFMLAARALTRGAGADRRVGVGGGRSFARCG